MKKGTRKTKSHATLGRPRAFDPEMALDCALRVFWKKGYEGTSLSDLTKVMGINKPSLYSAFGNKEQLFHKVLDRYASGPVAFLRDALAEPSAHAVAERTFLGAADMLTDKRNPAGCLIVQGALACGETAESIRKELNSRRTEGETALRLRFERARSEGDIPPDADPTDLARYVSTVLHGMAVEAVSGASREELRRVAEMAMRTWPE